MKNIKKHKLPLSHRPFKRERRYSDVEDAKRGVYGTSRNIERVANARIAAQELSKRIKAEGIKSYAEEDK